MNVFTRLWTAVRDGCKAIFSVLTIVPSAVYFFVALGIVIYFSVKHIRYLTRRRRFVKDLQALCLREGYTLSAVAHPYRSIYKLTDGEDFNVIKGDKKYSCKFIYARSKGTPVLLAGDGTLKLIHIVRVAKTEVFRYYTQKQFGYQSDDRKVLILHPVPKSVLGITATEFRL